MLLKSALYVINLEQFIASLICDLVVEHVPLAEQLCSTCKHISFDKGAAVSV
jgi:hypothetical protein